jgi:predicted Rossmann fold flavoprotein
MINNVKKVVIIGGGPAGMMAAIRASQLVKNVILVEKNTVLGKKLLLSGNGRCNLTNSETLESFLKGYTGNGNFLRDACKVFFNNDLIQFFESRKLPLITEHDGKIFPKTNSASSVRDVLENELGNNNVKIIFNTELTDILVQNKKVKAVYFRNGSMLKVDCLIISTGGITYSSTGSDGEGMRIVERLGHTIVSLRPGLVPFLTDKKYPAALNGLSLKQVRVVFTFDTKKITSNIGDLLFTRNGISGPLILSISGQIVNLLEKDITISAFIDLIPLQSIKEVEATLMNELKNNYKKSVSTVLKKRYPYRLIDLAMNELGIDPKITVSQLKASDRKKIVSFLKGIPLRIIGFESLEKAMITMGGISLKEIDPRAMSSKVVDGLFFAGEMIDIDGDTGGYNLQEAFSTGYLAGESAARYVID